MARGTKTQVSKGERQMWLEQLDNGKGITAIANTAGRDIRTVKQNIEIAGEERVMAQARRDYVRGLIEQHQGDLLSEVLRIKERVMREPPIASDSLYGSQPRLYGALKEHLGRSLAGSRMDTYERSREGYFEANEKVERNLLTTESDKKEAFSRTVKTYPWVADVMGSLAAEAWKDVPWELEYNSQIITAPDGSQGSYPTWGKYSLTISIIPTEQEPDVFNAHRQLVSKAKSYLPALIGPIKSLRVAKQELTDELDTFLLKRFLTGHCDLCL